MLHAISNVPVTLLGLVFMAREGLSVGRMREMAAGRETASDDRPTSPKATPSGVTPPSGVIQ